VSIRGAYRISSTSQRVEEERATIDGVEIVRVNGKYSITSPYGQWRDKDEKEVYAILHYLYRKRG